MSYFHVAVMATTENVTVQCYTWPMVFLIIVHVRWCPAETCKINLVVQYISCLLCGEAEIGYFLFYPQFKCVFRIFHFQG